MTRGGGGGGGGNVIVTCYLLHSSTPPPTCLVSPAIPCLSHVPSSCNLSCPFPLHPPLPRLPTPLFLPLPPSPTPPSTPPSCPSCSVLSCSPSTHPFLSVSPLAVYPSSHSSSSSSSSSSSLCLPRRESFRKYGTRTSVTRLNHCSRSQ